MNMNLLSSSGFDQIENVLLEQRIAIKKAALNAKNINRRLNCDYANTEEEIKQRTDELKALKEHAAELKEIADGQDAEKIRLKQQIRRERAQLTNKKKRESDDGLANRFVISLNDRNVACKSAFKAEVLKDALNLHFIEKRNARGITLKGCVSTPDDLQPFETKRLGDADDAEIAFFLWSQIKKGSGHMDFWDALISHGAMNKTI